MLNIIRGDTKYYKFQRINKTDESVITTKPDVMYFTVKFADNVEDYLIQKTLENGIIFDDETNYYYFTINPEDTNNLPYGGYVYDIEITEGPKVTTIAIGDIILTEEVTFSSNKENDGVNGEDVIIEDDEIEEIAVISEYAPTIIGGSMDYREAQNKPSINGIELVDDKTSEELGLQPAGDYIKIEELTDALGIVDENIKKVENEIPDISDLASEDYVDDKVQGLIDGDIANLTELIIENKDNIQDLKENKADITDIPTKTSELENDSGFITEFEEEDPTIPDYVKQITEEDITNWNNKLSSVPDNYPTNDDMNTAIESAINNSITSALEDDY